MYFKTKKNSNTGKKFQVINDKLNMCFNAQIEFINSINAKQFRPGIWLAAGGISSIIFDENYNVPKHFKLLKDTFNEYMPKLNCKDGKIIQEKIDKLPTVSIRELNNCIGFKEDMFKTIGFNMSNDEYFIFTTREEWNITIPNDC